MNMYLVGVGAMDETPEEWLARLFEFEFCAECGGDTQDHEVCIVPGIGNYFARCLRGRESADNGDHATSEPADGPRVWHGDLAGR
jgi:hypothetical protein